jgi:hypothetical protein
MPSKLIQSVIEGNQVAAIQALNNTGMPQQLLRAQEAFSDFSGRTFSNCSAIEYAYWVGDYPMCLALIARMEDDVKALTLQRLSVIDQQGLKFNQDALYYNSSAFSLEPMINALEAFQALCEEYTSSKGRQSLFNIGTDPRLAQWYIIYQQQHNLPTYISQVYGNGNLAQKPENFPRRVNVINITETLNRNQHIWYRENISDRPAVFYREVEGLKLLSFRPDTRDLSSCFTSDIKFLKEYNGLRPIDREELKARLNPTSSISAAREDYFKELAIQKYLGPYFEMANEIFFRFKKNLQLQGASKEELETADAYIAQAEIELEADIRNKINTFQCNPSYSAYSEGYLQDQLMKTGNKCFPQKSNLLNILADVISIILFPIAISKGVYHKYTDGRFRLFYVGTSDPMQTLSDEIARSWQP